MLVVWAADGWVEVGWCDDLWVDEGWCEAEVDCGQRVGKAKAIVSLDHQRLGSFQVRSVLTCSISTQTFAS